MGEGPNPDIGVKKAMNLSKVMTNGHIADLFILELSFTGWIFLCYLAFGFSYLFLKGAAIVVLLGSTVVLLQYFMTTMANVYTDLKAEELRIGKLTPADFVEEKRAY